MASKMPEVGPKAPPATEVAGSLAATASGPASTVAAGTEKKLPATLQMLAVQKTGLDEAARGCPFNLHKEAEHGRDNGLCPRQGEHFDLPAAVSAGTMQEGTASAKVGAGEVKLGQNAVSGNLDPVRSDATGQVLTTDQGLAISDNQNSLKAGVSGPTLLEDFILREKITHFDHERIPERVVHARGSAAHGYFECTRDMSDVTKATVFSEVGKRTPVFTRFSPVAGNKGSADVVRDTRGFAVKFYTDAGVWDLVGNNIPVFFIQDAMKFPDVIHSVKPEPHHGMPQASSAHDTFFDFITLSPETTHHLLWQMSDRGIPRSYRTMQGFGIHTFRLVNAAGESHFVKFHWQPVAGTHSLVWDEAVIVNGADPDFHRRDLWEAIEAGVFPTYELCFQMFTEEQANGFDFDVLDPSKLIPEELVPLQVVGRMVLDRNPDNFFCETEQVAYCPSHVIPGIDFTNDPLLQGRLFSYLDTQLTRLGGPNFNEIPINRTLAPPQNNHRGGLHRATINRGRVSYEPNSLGGGCPFQAGAATGFVTYPERLVGDGKLRTKPESFRDHYSQPRLFYRSQTPAEQAHIRDAFIFELTRVTVPAIRERMVSVLANVDGNLAMGIATGLGMDVPPAQPVAMEPKTYPGAETSPALSLFARQGDGSIAGRKIALLVADGVEPGPVKEVYKALADARAMVQIVGPKLGAVKGKGGETFVVETTVSAMPSALWDAVVIAGGAEALQTMVQDLDMVAFVRDQYRFAKAMFLLAPAEPLPKLLEKADVRYIQSTGMVAPGLISLEDGEVDKMITKFQAAVAQHRHFNRE